MYGRKVKSVKLSTRQHLNLCIDNSLTLCPAHCHPLTRLAILSVLPALTLPPLKSSHSHTPPHLKQVNTRSAADSDSWLVLKPWQGALSLNIKVLHLGACSHDSHPGPVRLHAGWSPTTLMCWERLENSQIRAPWAELDSIYHRSMLPLIFDCLGSASVTPSSNGSVFDGENKYVRNVEFSYFGNFSSVMEDSN